MNKSNILLGVILTITTVLNAQTVTITDTLYVLDEYCYQKQSTDATASLSICDFNIGRGNALNEPYINRSYYTFNISQITTASNVTIDNVAIFYYNDRNSSTKQIFTVFEDLGSNQTEIWEQIVDSDTLESDLEYKLNITRITSINLRDYISENLDLNTLKIGGASMSENVTNSKAALGLALEITYTSDVNYSMTIRNNFMGQYGGTVGVGVNSSAVQRNSPYTFNTQNGTLLNLAAYDGQSSDEYTWVFNDNEAPELKSFWQKTFETRPAVHMGNNQSFSTTTNNDADATISNLQRRLHNVSRIDQTEMGNTSAGIVATAVQGNDTTITAPATKTVSGKTLYFTGWSDGVASNPRSVSAIDHTTLTALFKGSQLATSVASNSKPNQQKIVQTANGWLHRTYESMGRVWYEAKPPTGDW